MTIITNQPPISCDRGLINQSNLLYRRFELNHIRGSCSLSSLLTAVPKSKQDSPSLSMEGQNVGPKS